MPAYIDYTGKKIGRATIIESVEKSPCSRWKCVCQCGETFICLARSFKRGETFECDKCRFERKRGIDLTGRKFGRWTVKERRINALGKTEWFVLCDCGNTGLVAGCILGTKKSMSCGCYGRKKQSIRANTTIYPPEHLTSTTNIYCIRARILQNCYNPKNVAYHLYGKKGITVCELWRNGAKDFYNWCIENGWKEDLVVHLKRGKKVFSPENCEILSAGESMREHRGKRITIESETLNVFEWSKICGLSRHTILDRLTKGYSEKDAVFAKSHENSGKKEWDDEEIKKLYESGLSLADVGRKMGKNYSAISKRLKYMGIEVDTTTMKRRKFSFRNCIICKNEFEPTSSNAQKCENCRKKRNAT